MSTLCYWVYTTSTVTVDAGETNCDKLTNQGNRSRRGVFSQDVGIWQKTNQQNKLWHSHPVWQLLSWLLSCSSGMCIAHCQCHHNVQLISNFHNFFHWLWCYMFIICLAVKHHFLLTSQCLDEPNTVCYHIVGYWLLLKEFFTSQSGILTRQNGILWGPTTVAFLSQNTRQNHNFGYYSEQSACNLHPGIAGWIYFQLIAEKSMSESDVFCWEATAWGFTHTT